ncbi:Glycoside hydrolase family 71 [Macrophomina phaseolina MS6]|uniref:Glycoside hydrolase family 71 n=1 Tax=Macrophomina phaseolina (strain MS6) TaxID=1126212 RepID=K2R9D0_MACPH|nr:Glycoside hydrolase family 71 [Macrophomina phaseolina MS6]
MRWASTLLPSATGALLFAALANGAPAVGSAATPTLKERQTSDRLVFAHFMIGISTDRTSSADYDADILRAKSLGIDAFALNFGPDTASANYSQQLVYAYESAANNGFSVFLSFDFNTGLWDTADAAAVGARIAAFGSRGGQLKVDDKAFVSSFVGDALDVSAVRTAAGIDIFFAPNFNPGGGADWTQLDGAFSWYAWPTDGSNNPPSSTSTYLPTYADTDYTTKLGGDKTKYVAPVSPWFFTHYGSEVSFGPKNYLFPSEFLWFTRWQEILDLGSRFVEIITWNDYGESHYIGPLSSPHYDDGNSKWTNDMPHNGWADLAAPYIAAYKAGATSPTSYITTDRLVYWFRPQPKGLDCASTDNVGAAPSGADLVADKLFVVTMLTDAANVTVGSGGDATQTFAAPKGVASFTVPLAVGVQAFAVERGGVAVDGLGGQAPKQVSGECVCGLYNFNAFVGTLPVAEQGDALQADGLSRFTEGLKVATCSPTPTLAARR